MIGRIHNIYKVTQAQKERKKTKTKTYVLLHMWTLAYNVIMLYM